METAVIIIAILGGVFGAILAIAGKKLAVEEDPRKDEILALLPGANCGGCGYAGCAAMADAIVAGQEEGAMKCAACAAENKKAIKAVMGLAADDDENAVRMIPRLHCNGCKENRPAKYKREGVKNCFLAAATLASATLAALAVAPALMPAASAPWPWEKMACPSSTMINALAAVPVPPRARSSSLK